MRSFRLDPDSVTEFLRSWPVVLIGGLTGGGIAYCGQGSWWVRLLIPCLLGISLGPRCCVGRIRERYPTSRHPWLLSIGMMTVLFGVALRMAFPSWQGQDFDLTWLGMAFVTILAFVLLNRGNKDGIE